jgi:soluble lytic murein transglycosylase-like protein
MNWQEANDGPKWIPVITVIEKGLGIPPGLLSRMAFQESSFRTDVIDGTHASPAGALGILQLEPPFFTEVDNPTPFTPDVIKQQIIRSGQYLVELYGRFKDWSEALAAYNFGPGNEDKYLEHKISGLPQETLDYVSDITKDVPV